MKQVIKITEDWLSGKGVKHPKSVVYGGIAIIGGLLAFFIVRGVARALRRYRAAHPTQASLMQGMTDQLGALSVQGATITDGEASLISENLLYAMNRFGTDEQAIFDNLARCRNAADLNLVIKKFGIKFYDGIGLSTGIIEKHIAALHLPYNLNAWLRAELSGSDLQKVKDIFDKLGVPF